MITMSIIMLNAFMLSVAVKSIMLSVVATLQHSGNDT
jgi:hypothetical protein